MTVLQNQNSPKQRFSIEEFSKNLDLVDVYMEGFTPKISRYTW